MKRAGIFGVLMVVTLVFQSEPSARVDPLSVVTERLVRAEILIVLDTSGSMSWYPDPANVVKLADAKAASA